MEERVVLSTLTVVSDADAGPGSLREALAAAQPGDVVQFDPGLDGRTIYLTSGELDVDEDLTIQGPGASLLSIDAGGLSRVFDLESAEAEVTISGLTIRGGKAEMGGGVLVQGGGLTLVDSVIVGNLATAEEPGGTAAGGGVAVLEGGSLTANDTVFAGNIAQGGRGADGGTGWRNGFGGGGYGGGVYTEGSSLTIVGGSFLGNRAVGGRGGDGGYNGDGGDARGGAIFLGTISDDGEDPDSTVDIAATLTNLSIRNNTALGGRGKGSGRGGDAAGGGLFVDRYSRVFLNRGVIAGNRAIGGLGGGAGNAGVGVGGGVYLTTGGSTRSWTLIMRNYASTLDDDIHGMFS